LNLRFRTEIGENNENPDEKNEKQGYPFGVLVTYREVEAESCEAKLCCAERVKTLDFGNETGG